jgi:cytoplasmic iron level regulating protein YaaA (DUF328/UPF0246 family)
MLILVPAPMTKAPSAAGDPVELGALSFPELTDAREHVIERTNPRLRIAPTAPARDLYRGALLTTAMRDVEDQADDVLVYISALWGAVRPRDDLPEYRLTMYDWGHRDGGLVRYWREPLAAVLPTDEFIVDFRTEDYLEVWQPEPELHVRIKPVRDATFERGSEGTTTRQVRGRVLQRILLDGLRPKSAEELAEQLEPHFKVQLRDDELRVVQ